MQATDTECRLSAADAPSGNLTFSVTNGGSKVTEFYLLADDGLRIIGEIENIGPGLSRDLVLRAGPGEYFTACKPGMVGEGIRAPFAISDSGEDAGPSGSDVELVEQANQAYQAYVKDQTEQLVAKTEEFVVLYKTGKDDEARALYAPARVHWERIETVAESFGDLDPKMDIREADLEPGQEFTGWHRIEKDLWPARAKDYQPLDAAGRAKYADDLMANTNTLYDKTREPDLHRRPDRQRVARPAGRGGHRQGDRRGGVLVAHRPVGLPGQRRRGPGGLRRAAAAAAGQERRAGHPDRREVRRAADPAGRAQTG